MDSARPLRLALSASPTFAALIIAMHGIAAACFLTVLTGWLGLTAAALVFSLGMAAAWDRALLAGRRSPQAIEFRPSGEAYCTLGDGSSLPIEARGAVTRHWVSMRLRAPWRRSLLVAAGMLTADNFRLLRLWALWGKVPAVARRQLGTSP